MNTKETIFTLELKAKLSALWIFVLLNMLFRDIHELGRPGMLAEMMSSNVSEELFLFAGIFLQIPLGMVILSRLLPPNINRWANMIAAGLTIVAVINAGPADLDDFFFAGVEIVTLLLIIWLSWRWRTAKEEM
jgi:hypothetical protein